MASVVEKSALIICGDYMEDYEVMVPFYVLQAFGVRVDCVSPNKLPGDRCITAIHEFLGFELYSELPGHLFTLNSNFDEVDVERYDSLIIPGGRFTELFSVDDKVLSIVKGLEMIRMSPNIKTWKGKEERKKREKGMGRRRNDVALLSATLATVDMPNGSQQVTTSAFNNPINGGRPKSITE